MQTSIPVNGPAGGAPQASGIAVIPAAETTASGVSWSAIAAGALAAAALSFILLILGVGLGLSAVSPWSYNDAPVGKSAIIWAAFMELASAGVGGYLAGRLRVKWANVHGDEVYFRDTAHGLLAWGLATLLTAALMAGAVRTVLSGAIDAGAGAATAIGATAAAGASAGLAKGGALPALPGAGQGANSSASASAQPATNPAAYYTDMLLRTDAPLAETDNGALRAEVGRILVQQPGNGPSMAVDDRQYLARLVAKRTGVEQAEAERRVDDVHARMVKARADAEAAAKNAAEQARKAGAQSALWMFVALLLGAFIASLAATFGGKLRDAGSAAPAFAAAPRR
ncbi:hypothetical protein [Pseudoduganella aquatica]|uniref:hypothetical protein n=1 Tax=Pseudoduganella aquatica TaxID=2660641 RepID=UPI001E3A78C5|nr:hypothetical protein [Pseudoduganella aquatica]